MAIQITATKESLAAAYAGLCTHASLHTGAPGTGGANEASGGSPAYARKPITWNAGSVDGVYTSNAIDFDVPAGSYAYVGLWDALTAGSFRDYVSISATFTAQGILRVTLTYTQS